MKEFFFCSGKNSRIFGLKKKKKKTLPFSVATPKVTPSSPLFLPFSFLSFHLQLHGGSAHFRLPGRPLQPKGHPELWHFLLVHCYPVQLLHQQRGTTQRCTHTQTLRCYSVRPLSPPPPSPRHGPNTRELIILLWSGYA